MDLLDFPLCRNSDVQSHEKDGDGLPLLQLCPPVVSVRSFSHLCALLQLAGDGKLAEVRACLEGESIWFTFVFISWKEIWEKERKKSKFEWLKVHRPGAEYLNHPPDLFFLPANPHNSFFNRCLFTRGPEWNTIKILFAESKCVLILPEVNIWEINILNEVPLTAWASDALKDSTNLSFVLLRKQRPGG